MHQIFTGEFACNDNLFAALNDTDVVERTEMNREAKRLNEPVDFSTIYTYRTGPCTIYLATNVVY